MSKEAEGCPRTRGGSWSCPLARGWGSPLPRGSPPQSPFGLRLRLDIKIIPGNFWPIPRTVPDEDFLKYKTTEKTGTSIGYLVK